MTAQPASQPRNPLLEWFAFALTAGALIGYYLPWIANRAAALSANAFDLAEWVSLSPAQRVATPPLPASGLLRAGLLGMALLFALRGRVLPRWLGAGIAWLLALILAATLIPPVEFFRDAGSDPNYVQLMSLAIGAFLGLAGIGIVGLRLRSVVFWRRLEALIGGLTLIAVLVGGLTAIDVVSGLGIRAPVGAGLMLSVICLGAGAVTALLPRG